MADFDGPIHGPPQCIAGDWSVLPSWLPVPGMGVLPVNSYLMAGREPVLVDTGLSALADDFLAALESCVDPLDLRWIWLSHTDPDHIGNLRRVLDIAPNATVVTNFLGAGKMGIMEGYDLGRVRVLDPGEVFEAGGRRFHQVRPPYYDAPETMGFFEEEDRVLFSADAFGALLPRPVEKLAEVDEGTLRDGLVGWSSVDAPWLANTDAAALGRIVGDLKDLEPEIVMSGHLPVTDDLTGLTDRIASAYARGTTGDVTSDGIRAVEAALS